MGLCWEGQSYENREDRGGRKIANNGLKQEERVTIGEEEKEGRNFLSIKIFKAPITIRTISTGARLGAHCN